MAHPFYDRWFVYAIWDNHDAVKIGMSSCVEKRLSQLQTSNPYNLDVIFRLECVDRDSAKASERAFHSKFADCRLNGEWFDWTRFKEWYDSIKDEKSFFVNDEEVLWKDKMSTEDAISKSVQRISDAIFGQEND